MGLRDLFISREKRVERNRARNIARATDKYKQSPDRMRALELLAQDGSDEALYGLLRRFSVTYDKSIEDEQEKEWVCQTLIDKGRSVLPALQRYLKNAESVTWPLRVLQAVAESRDEELTILREVLARHEPGYERDPTKKIQLITHLGHLRHVEVSALIVPYLEDMDEGVRYATVEALLRHKNEAIAREPLLRRFAAAEEDSLRLRQRIAEGFAELGWRVHGFRGQVEPRMPEGFFLDREGHVKARPGGET